MVAEESRVSRTSRRTGTVLIVDDNRVIRTFAAQLLRHFGYTVLEANNGHHALMICFCVKTPIHLVLTDTNMPYVNGFDLIARLKKIRIGFDVLYMTGYADAPERMLRSADPKERTDCIMKPFAGDHLLRMVDELLEKSTGDFSQIMGGTETTDRNLGKEVTLN